MTSEKRRRLLRWQAFDKQNGLCTYCGDPMWKHNGKQFARQFGIPRREVRHRKCTTEHLVAQRDGGQDTPENIAAACERCNWKRHAGRANCAPSPEEFRKEIQAARLTSSLAYPTNDSLNLANWLPAESTHDCDCGSHTVSQGR